MDPEKKTPRLCSACGGRGCKWCSGGFQDEEQQTDWKKFRSRMRSISSTYPMLENITRQLIKALEEAGTREAEALAERGRRDLSEWMESECDTEERRSASFKVTMFQNEALLAITKARRGAE